MCVRASPPVVLVVTFSFSDVNVVVCEVVSLIRIVKLWSRKPFLSRKCEASVALECETKMNIEGPPVKAVPESVHKDPRRKSYFFKR